MKLSLIVAAALTLLIGCNNNPPNGFTVSATPVPIAQPGLAPASVMNASDLDLSTTAGLIQNGTVQDANGLQAAINNPSSGINNVDIDKDGNIDPITVTEVAAPGGGRQFSLTANPTNGQPTVVANINITSNGGQSTVQAGYPAYVSGYQDNYYSYNTASNLAFMLWALSPRPLFVPMPYTSYAWYGAPRRVYAPGVISQTRSTYTTTTRVAPVARSAPPAAYTAQAQAQRVPSAFQQSAAARPTPTTNNLNDRASAQDFNVRAAAPVQRATGFGASSTPTSAPVRASAPAAAPAASPRPTGFGGASFGGGGSSGPRTAPRSKPGH